jgi:type II secretory pathway component PulK
MKSERGSAVLVVLTMLAVLTALILVNGNTVRQLDRELRRVDQQQQQRFQK